MIRVNLIRNRKGALTDPGGPSAFSSRREMLLAALFLLLGGSILFYVLSGNRDAAPVAAANRFDISRQDSFATDAQSAPGGQDSSPAPAGVQYETATPGISAATEPRAEPALPDPVGPAPGSSPRSPQAPVPPAPKATTVHSLRVSPEVNRMRVFLASDGWAEYKLFRVENPDRLVLDLPGVAHDIPGPERTQRFDHPLVQEIRIAQNQIEPPLVRLVFVVRDSPEVRILPRPDALIIEISGGQE